MDPKELIVGVERRFLSPGALPQGVFWDEDLWDRVEDHCQNRPRGQAVEPERVGDQRLRAYD
ncbi:MAG: hypothetical protein QJR00_06490, partial [Bacillota bacterium]|nr:hypothetical protein [Bacillota bacterium]